MENRAIRDEDFIGRHLLNHGHLNCSPAAIDQFPSGIFTLQQKRNGAVVLHIIGTAYIFCVIAIICEHYFVPAIEKFVSICKIESDVTGAAIMATAASVPQLATATVGVFVAKSDIGIGAIIGSSYFNVFFTMGLCAFISTETLQLSWWPVSRDCFFYAIAAASVASLLPDKNVTWWNCVVLLILYCLYILVLVFNWRIEHIITKMLRGIGTGLKRCRCKNCGEKRTEDKEEMNFVAHSCTNATGPRPEGTMDYMSIPKDEKHIENDSENVEKTSEYHSIMHMPDVIWRRVVWIILLPAIAVVYLVIPDCRRPGTCKYMFLLTVLLSMVLIGCSSYVLVWLVAFIGNVAGIPDTIMGMTFLAAGSSIPDVINAVLVTKHGFGDMAVSNCVGSNIFDILLGFGLPWLLAIVSLNHGRPLIIYDDVTMISISLILSAFSVFVLLSITKWKLTKVVGGILIAGYIVFVTITAVYSVRTALPTCDTPMTNELL